MHFMAVKKSRKRSVFVIYSYTVFERHCIYSQLKGMRTMYVNIYLGYNLSIEEIRRGLLGVSLIEPEINSRLQTLI